MLSLTETTNYRYSVLQKLAPCTGKVHLVIFMHFFILLKETRIRFADSHSSRSLKSDIRKGDKSKKYILYEKICSYKEFILHFYTYFKQLKSCCTVKVAEKWMLVKIKKKGLSCSKQLQFVV